MPRNQGAVGFILFIFIVATTIVVGSVVNSRESSKLKQAKLLREVDAEIDALRPRQESGDARAESERLCPSCGGKRCLGNSGLRVFRPRRKYMKIFCRAPYLDYQSQICVCLDCGLVWSQIDREGLLGALALTGDDVVIAALLKPKDPPAEG